MTQPTRHIHTHLSRFMYLLHRAAPDLVLLYKSRRQAAVPLALYCSAFCCSCHYDARYMPQ